VIFVDNRIEKIKRAVKNEMKKCNGLWQWEGHILIVEKYAMMLAEKLGGDKEVIELAVFLHDITRLGGLKEDHNVSGTKKAGKLLEELGYPDETIEKVKHCILTHRGDPGPESLEAKILASADAMSHFDIIPVLVWVALEKNGFNLKESWEWVYEKIQRDWNKKILLPEAKDMVRDKYEASKTIFEASKNYIEKMGI